MKRPVRYLRDVDGFEAAAEEVIRRCAPSPFKRSIAKAGAWIPPDSVTVVTPALLYGLCVGMDRQRHCLHLEEKAREEQGPDNVVDLFPHRRPYGCADILQGWESKAARWLPPHSLDRSNYRHVEAERFLGGPLPHEGRLDYEPTIEEFRAGLFGMGEGTGP